MGKPKSSSGKLNKNSKKNNGLKADEAKNQPKISSYFSKSPPKSLNLKPNLKKFSKSKVLSSLTSLESSNSNKSCKQNDTSTITNLCVSPCKTFDDDSDIEIIESTPEPVKTKNLTLLKLNNGCQDSPDEIPPTPQFSSRLGNNTKLNSFLNGSLKNKRFSNSLKLQISPLRKIGSKSTYKSSIKREAETSTGVSPDAKRLNDNTPSTNIGSCKLNLLNKMNSSIHSDISKNENESSFSVLQPVIKHSNGKALPFEENDKIENMIFQNTEHINQDIIQTESSFTAKNEDVSDFKENSKNICNTHTDTSVATFEKDSVACRSKETEEYTQENMLSQNTLKENPDILIQNTSNFTMHNEEEIESFRGNTAITLTDSTSPTYKVNNDSCNLKSYTANNCSNKNVEYFLQSDDSLENLLSESFDKLSPFKEPDKQSKTEEKYSASIERHLNEGLGAMSFAVSGNFGRFIVVGVERNIYQREMLLHLISPINRCSKQCHLSGYWYESYIKEGDIVHILFSEELNNQFYVSDHKGIIVVNPDYLISGTSVVSAVFCPRKSVLNERFKGYDGGNKIMIIGSLVHQLFQDIVTKKICEEADIMALINDLVSHPRVLKEFYGLNISAKEVLEDMKQFVPLIKSWNENYLKSGSNCGQIPEKNWEGKIAAVKDIEENFWSPRFGLKGKIDLTVEAEVGNTSKILPLELKTGRPSFSAEHKGQVTLYSMIMSDRRKDPQSGLLLYLKDGSMAEVPAGEKEKKALIQLRNDVVRYLAEKSSKVEGTDLNLPSFPPPLDSQRMCSRCAHLLTCTTLLKVKGDDIPTEHSMNRLIPMATGHLSESHFEYFRKWCIMLHLEISATDNESSIRSLWCQDPSQRESHGNCLSHMSLARNPEDFSNGYFLHTFHRKNIMNNSIEQLPKCFQVGESVLVSSESEIALSLGVVYNIEEKDSIALVLDKDLTIYPSMKNKKLFIDRCEYQNNMSIFFTNVSELLRDTERSEKLRRLIIDKEPPDFKEGLARKLLLDNKSILKGMNKEQQRAILRSLLSQDYAILKGYPGTGKTSTIIGLVRLLNAAGHSVLLTSYTHSAVDNILLKLKEYEDIKFLRLGKISRIRKDILPHSDEILTKNMKTLTEIEEFYDQTKIVATTCLGMGHVLFRRKTFDFCIMDEASQVLEAAALGPLFFCTRFILVGDSLQLPPVIKSQTAKELGMMKSLFERLDDENATVCLSLQYRMNEPIMNVANQLIYEGQLKCGTDELKSSTLLDLITCSPSDHSAWLSRLISCKLEDSFLLVDTLNGAPEERDCSGQIINVKEANVIYTILRCFVKMGIPFNEIGIITPYRAQVKYMKENMPSETNNCDSCIEVNTVDQYQGRDKNVILYSCVRSGLREGNIKKGEILNDIRRLNVAVTRAKTKLIILGCLETLRLFEPFEKLINSIKRNQIYELKENVDDFTWKSI